MDCGWIWRIPLQHRVGNGDVYSSAFISDERAEEQIGQLEAPPIAEPNRLRFLAGKRESNGLEIVLPSGFRTGFSSRWNQPAFISSSLGLAS